MFWFGYISSEASTMLQWSTSLNVTKLIKLSLLKLSLGKYIAIDNKYTN